MSSSSLYDNTDDSESDYSAVRSQPTPSGIKLLRTKAKVYTHPTSSVKDNIPGYIAVYEQKDKAILLGWSAESSIHNPSTYHKVEFEPGRPRLVPSPPVVTISPGSTFAIPIDQIYSLFVRPPNVGWWFGSIVINTKAGESLPALFFHDSECESTIQQRKKLQRETFDISAGGSGMFWGGDEILKWLREHVTVERSSREPNTYLINPTEEDKQSFVQAERPRAKKADNGMKWNFLEKMAQVTTFTRRTAAAVAEHKNTPPQLKRLMQNPQVQTVSDEFDSARLYLARWAMGIAEQSEKERNQRIWTAKDVLQKEETELGEFEVLDISRDKREPVSMSEWSSLFNSRTGRLERTPDEVKERIFHGGLDDDVRKEAWLFLLGVHGWESSAEERTANLNSLRDEYIRLKGAWWERMVDEQGTAEEREWWKEQRMRIEKDVHRTDRHLPIFAGEDIPHPDPDSPFAEAGTNVHLEQLKDLLLTYNEYNPDLGYVQGMSDLLAPIYVVAQDDAIAFWGFVRFMERMERNFLRDQSGMRLQLLTLDHLCQLVDPQLYQHLQKVDSTNFFFFFRMLLVWFKREFEFDGIQRLWETLWTDYLSSNYHLFIAMAILEKHREVIMEHLNGFDEVLKYVNELSGKIDLPSTIVRAETVFNKFRKMVDAIDKKGSFPEVAAKDSTPTASSSAASSSKTASASPSTTAVISPQLRQLLSREIAKHVKP